VFVREVNAVLEVLDDKDAFRVLHGHQLEIHVGPSVFHCLHLLFDAFFLDGLCGDIVNLLYVFSEPFFDALPQVEVVLFGVDLGSERGAERLPVAVLHRLDTQTDGHWHELVELDQCCHFILSNFGQEFSFSLSLEKLLGLVQVGFVGHDNCLDIIFGQHIHLRAHPFFLV